MLMEGDRDVSALPINGTRRPGKTYVFGAVSLFLLKGTTRVPILETENRDLLAHTCGGENSGNSTEVLLKSKGKADTLPRQGDAKVLQPLGRAVNTCGLVVAESG